MFFASRFKISVFCMILISFNRIRFSGFDVYDDIYSPKLRILWAFPFATLLCIFVWSNVCFCLLCIRPAMVDLQRHQAMLPTQWMSVSMQPMSSLKCLLLCQLFKSQNLRKQRKVNGVTKFVHQWRFGGETDYVFSIHPDCRCLCILQ